MDYLSGMIVLSLTPYTTCGSSWAPKRDITTRHLDQASSSAKSAATRSRLVALVTTRSLVRLSFSLLAAYVTAAGAKRAPVQATTHVGTHQ